MKKRLFQIFAVLMIVGLLAGTLSPLLLQFASTNSSDVTNQDTTQVPSEETTD